MVCLCISSLYTPRVITNVREGRCNQEKSYLWLFYFKIIGLVFYCWHNKLPKFSGLKDSHLLFHSSLGQRSGWAWAGPPGWGSLTGLKMTGVGGLCSFLEALGESSSKLFQVLSGSSLWWWVWGPVSLLVIGQGSILAPTGCLHFFSCFLCALSHNRGSISCLKSLTSASSWRKFLFLRAHMIRLHPLG